MPSPPPDPQHIAEAIAEAIDIWNSHTERGMQKTSGELGISDIGHCRQAAAYLLAGQPFTDNPNKWKAFVGSAIDDLAKEAIKLVWPDTITKHPVVLTLPSGRRYPGNPDLIRPAPVNMVLDLKAPDGLTVVKRHGFTQRNRFQNHGYGGALVQEGMFTEDQLWVGNVWLDRSGRHPVPHVAVEPYDPLVLHEMDEWISDAEYAAQYGEEAPKDRPIDWCTDNCEFFRECRGEDVLRDRHGGGLLTDPETLEAVLAYLEAKEDRKRAEQTIEDAKRALAGVSGSTGTHVVKWTHVNETYQEALVKAPHERLNIRPIPPPTPLQRRRRG
jgi:hypothetical protein